MTDTPRRDDFYWFIGYTDGRLEFFRGEERLTEEEWRSGAPADEIARLNVKPRNAA